MRKFNLKGAIPPSPKYWWLNGESSKVLEKGYLYKEENVEEAIFRITSAAAKRLNMDYLQPLFAELVERGWMSLSSPIWANMGTPRGLPISCFGSYFEDSMKGIIWKEAEIKMQMSLGGGTSGYFGALRERGAKIKDNGKTSGPVSFMRIQNTDVDVISQGGIRRGAFASYLDIFHPDIEEFLQIKSVGSDMQNLFTGVCIPDWWIKEMKEGDREKRTIWAKVIESRQQKGMPYLFFSDNVNNQKPDVYKATDSTIWASNLCSEIALPSLESESFICCLASMNLELYDEWKDTDAVKLAIFFLDAVLSEFIEKTSDNPFMKTTRDFAIRHRAVGLGVMALHSYYQKNNWPFESWEARAFNSKVFKHIQDESKIASEELGELLGYAPIFNEVEGIKKYRNTTTMTIAPTTSSSSILGQVSPGIEPFSSNYYKAGLAKGNFMRKNKYLEKLLEEKGLNTDKVWNTIMLNGGSVLTLDFLTEEEKNVFKTFKEISQLEIINQAASRQRFIDQSQSLNLNIPAELPVKEVNKLYLHAHEVGIKTLYYQRSQSVAKELVNSLVTCSSCEA